MRNKQTRICYRVSPCTCGCQGRDPWHPAHFKRVIREIEEEPGICQTHAYGYSNGFSYSKRGVAKFPWGKQRVYFIHGIFRKGTPDERIYDLGWFVGYGDNDAL